MSFDMQITALPKEILFADRPIDVSKGYARIVGNGKIKVYEFNLDTSMKMDLLEEAVIAMNARNEELITVRIRQRGGQWKRVLFPSFIETRFSVRWYGSEKILEVFYSAAEMKDVFRGTELYVKLAQF